MSATSIPSTDIVCPLYLAHPCQCRASSPIVDDLEYTAHIDDNDYVGLSDDDDDEITPHAIMVDDAKLVDILSDQAEMDTDSCNMSIHSSLSFEDSLQDSVSSMSGSMMVEMDSDHSDAEEDDIGERRFPIQYAPTYISPMRELFRNYKEFIANPTQHVSPPRLPQMQHAPPNSRPQHRMPPLATRLDATDLEALGLIPQPIKAQAPIYPASLPYVRCCYDSNVKRGCGKGNKCYHIHADPSHRCSDHGQHVNGRHLEIRVDRPHFQSFESSESPATETLPCHYGIDCKDGKHRDIAVKHKFDAAAMKKYDQYLKSYRSYEYELIKHQLAVNKARRELTDETVIDAFVQFGETSQISLTARQQLSAHRLWK